MSDPNLVVPAPVLAPSAQEIQAAAAYKPKSDEDVNATVAAIEEDAAILRSMREQTPANVASNIVAERQATQDRLDKLNAQLEAWKRGDHA